MLYLQYSLLNFSLVQKIVEMTVSAKSNSVILWLADFCRLPIETITSSSRLREDLGVDGDDATELMTDFVRRFKVGWGTYHHDSYFYPEGFDFTAPLQRIVSAVTGEPKTVKEPLYVQRLLDAVERGEFL
jgi:hypothetical protein